MLRLRSFSVSLYSPLIVLANKGLSVATVIYEIYVMSFSEAESGTISCHWWSAKRIEQESENDRVRMWSLQLCAR
jgi:hypothetical protein